jgi:hypothetical protein
MSSSKKFDRERDFPADNHLSEAQNPITLPLTHCVRVYSLLIHTGKGGGGRVEPGRRLERQQFTNLGSKIPT